MNGALTLIIGLLIGLGIGIAIGLIRANSEQGKVALLTDQLAKMREEEGRLTTLNEQLKAVTTSMTTLSTQAQDAEIKRAQIGRAHV